MKATMEQQLELERVMYEGGKTRFHKQQQRVMDNNNQGDSDLAWNIKLVKEFIEPLAKGLESYIKQLESNKRYVNKTRPLWALALCDPYQAAYITIKNILDSVALRESTSAQYLAKEIASEIEDQLKFSSFHEAISEKTKSKDKETKIEGLRMKSYLAKTEKGIKQAQTKSYTHKKNVYNHVGNTLGLQNWTAWDDDLKMKVGDVLLKLAVMLVETHDKETGEFEPLFYMGNINIGKFGKPKSSKIIGITPRYAQYVATFIEKSEYLYPEVGPCIIPPRDWRTPFIGGFHSARMSYRNPLIKSNDTEHVKKLTKSQMPKVYKAVNLLQKTKWKVNTEVLDILLEVLKKESYIGLPEFAQKPKPINPLKALSNWKDIRKLKTKELKAVLDPYDFECFMEWKKEVRQWNDKDRSRTSKIAEILRTKKLAEKYAEYDELFFVYSLDYRCRIYTRAAGLSPQGGDLQKSLLTFARKKKLGKFGDFWLLANGSAHWGVKGGIDELIGFFMSDENKAMVKSIAADPTKDKSWTKAKKKWQFLAWCFVYADYLEHIESGKDKADFELSHYGSMDGTCSGLQHYSAMLLDEIGGKAVNLTVTDYPMDIYQDVADETLDNIRRNPVAKKDRKVAQYWLKCGLMGRGITKTSVMTLPYSSTFITCRESVEEYLDEVIKDEIEQAANEGRAAKDPLQLVKFGVTQEEITSYASRKIWDSIGVVVIAAKKGMKCIKDITRECVKLGKPLIYENYVGFIMKQEQFEKKERTVESYLLGRVQYKVYEDTDKLSMKDMLSCSCPNIIHNQDSCHLVLTVCDAADKGVEDFYVVHDDFGTHCCQCGMLSKSLRYCFVEMYEYNVLEDLLYQQEERLHRALNVEIPKQGNLNIQDVKQSKYIFM